MIDCYGFPTRDICLPEPEDRYQEPEHFEYSEPFLSSPYLPTMPDTAASRAWKKRLADSCKKGITR